MSIEHVPCMTPALEPAHTRDDTRTACHTHTGESDRHDTEAAVTTAVRHLVNDPG